ncbi:MAG: TIGR03936 family radical SAM-associated protein [Clostridia bacterium]|nr:TIGR03936 family radical SAM-associated protein [Clostridia bacterium]
MQEIRIRFFKTGRAKYISHLDLVRFFGRAFKRAGIPLWYTEGFNPRPYMNFSMPLTLGAEGLNEAVDIRLIEDMDFDEIIRRMREVMPEDIGISSISEPKHKMTEIAESQYLFEITPALENAGEVYENLVKVMQMPELNIEKMGKKGRTKVLKTINIAEHKKAVSITPGDTISMRVTLPSTNQFGINPRIFIDRIVKELGLVDPSVRILRENLYVSDGSVFI